MRVAIRHVTRYAYDAPGSHSVQRLRLTPNDNPAQTVRSWTIEADGMEGATDYIDGFGNRVHVITHHGPYRELTIAAHGEVDTIDTGGMLGDLIETADPRVFLRPTPLTKSSRAIDALATGLPQVDALERMHRLLEAIASRVAYDTVATHAGTSAADAFSAGQGVCQDHAHIFIAAARKLSVPARYVTGYLHVEGEAVSAANHAWAEAWLSGLGWVGFDPANHICPTERYVRLACGFDAASAAPVTGTHRGGGTESLTVDVVVRQQQQ
jgi:transglutaminase-like putative cysteine protease